MEVYEFTWFNNVSYTLPLKRETCLVIFVFQPNSANVRREQQLRPPCVYQQNKVHSRSGRLCTLSKDAGCCLWSRMFYPMKKEQIRGSSARLTARRNENKLFFSGAIAALSKIFIFPCLPFFFFFQPIPLRNVPLSSIAHSSKFEEKCRAENLLTIQASKHRRMYFLSHLYAIQSIFLI